MSKQKIFYYLGLVLALEGCGTTGSGLLFIEPSIRRQDIQIRRVAFVPNRLPLNLQDPEKWRKYNWKVANENFEKQGFEVIDYETTVDAFNKSGLPVEDTKTSREKYAALSQQLGVDAIIVPYYGTFSSTKASIIINSFSYVSVATFQIYLAQQNDFLSRIDTNGKNRFATGFYLLPVIGLGILASEIDDEDDKETIGYIGLGVAVVGVLHDLYQTLRSSDSRWRAAFRRSIEEGLKPFFASYSPLPRQAVPRPEVELPEPEIASPRSATLALRSNSIRITSQKAINAAFAARGFFDINFNGQGKGAANQYAPEAKVISDDLTRLIWQQNGSDKVLDIQAAIEYIRNLNTQAHEGFTDWRLPTLDEAMSLMEPQKSKDGLHINAIFDKKQQEIWTADIYDDERTWIASFKKGGCNIVRKAAGESEPAALLYVRAVRSK